MVGFKHILFSFLNTPLVLGVWVGRGGQAGGESSRFAEGHSDAHPSWLQLKVSVEETSELWKEQGHQVQRNRHEMNMETQHSLIDS